MGTGVGETKSTADWKLMSVREKCAYLKSNITVEPILACYVMPSVLAGLATQNLNLEKACRVNLGYGEHVCSELTARHTANYSEEETHVQQLVAWMSVWKMALSSSFPMLLILFFGSWSDRRARRKPCLMLPILGEFLTSVGLIVCTYFFYELPMEVAGVVEALFPALTGGWTTMFVGVFSYIGDVTTVHMRTFRMGVVHVFVSLGMPFGMALSGILFRLIGFYGMFSLSSVLYVLGFTYGMMRVREPKPPIPRPPDVGFLQDFFNIEHVKETFEVAFKKRHGNRRQRVLMIMILSIVLVGPMFGETSVNYLFTRYRFNWDEFDFSMYSTYTVVVHLIGTMIAMTVFCKVLKMDDGLVGFIGCISKIAASFLFAFSYAPWMLYAGQVVEMLSGAGVIAMRASASKLVPADELGKVNSLFGVCEMTAPLIYSPMYSLVYASTLKVMPGAVYLLGAALVVPAALMFLAMYWLTKRGTEDMELAVTETPGPSKTSACINEAFQDDHHNDVQKNKIG
ncbi:proton-coupled folate transporter-like [Bacillus rossius redtenbacheri]|uniref:proton-coupled folate transporter-like n=1 Tax=Bacillus rossius redtenbacheri TaxID=93214 RepID=UPI002FDCED0F